ncbi:MAG: YbaK/EbsC family protein [Actinomycetota bacterium]
MSAIIEYLQGKGVAFTILPTPQAVTSLETVRAHGASDAELARTVVMNYRFGFALMIIPDEAELNPYLAQAALDDPDARLASQREVDGHFAGMDSRSIPPLGLYFLTPMWIDPKVAELQYVTFAAGKASLVIRMRGADLFRDDPFVVTPLTGASTPAETTISVPDVAADIA